mgnify:CR=1 FL=1
MNLASALFSTWLAPAMLACIVALSAAGLLAWGRWRQRRLDLPPLEQLRDATRHLHRRGASLERSVIVMGAMEAALTPLMERIEAAHPVKVFSLPSVDHPQWGRHIELGVKGAAASVEQAFGALQAGLREVGAQLGPEMVRKTAAPG